MGARRHYLLELSGLVIIFPALRICRRSYPVGSFFQVLWQPSAGYGETLYRWQPGVFRERHFLVVVSVCAKRYQKCVRVAGGNFAVQRAHLRSHGYYVFSYYTHWWWSMVVEKTLFYETLRTYLLTTA